MKIACFDEDRIGVVRDDAIVDLTEITSQANDGVGAMVSVIANFADLRGDIERYVSQAEGLPLSSVTLQAPIPRPGKIIAMGSNYLEGTAGPPLPIWAFFKSPEAILGPGGTVILPDADARVFHHEPELVAIVGKTTKNASKDNALDSIFGYTGGIDVSGRFDIFAQSILNKSHDTFAPIGPWIVTADEIPNPQSLQIQLQVDGQARHDFNTSDMGHNISDCIEYVSSITTLNPGDLIFTGTNHQGIGPIQDGEQVEVTVEKIGKLKVQVSDHLKRTWNKGVDKEMGQRIIRMINDREPPGGIRPQVTQS